MLIDLNDKELVESLKYLLVSNEEKIQMETKSFDENRHCWIPDQKTVFIGATISEGQTNNESVAATTPSTTTGPYVTVVTDNLEVVTVKRTELLEMNSPEYEKCEDMANMTHLNDATIIHNLKERYLDYLIYTNSGLFCVVINPYRPLPIYTLKVINYYRGKNKFQVPPHLYLVADTAYCCMLKDRENQSMIITGESGAGKTENAKKAIQYFARIATRVTSKEKENLTNLEDQIASANPLLEAYGNAKTTRNNNSSRFGKFIRIHFGLGGTIVGTDIETYLLEKSRVTFQQPTERNFHIFYQLLSPTFPELHCELQLKPEPSQYFYISQGMLTIDHVNDAEEMTKTNAAFEVLNFQIEEKLQLFRCTAAVIHFGNISWKQRPREEQADVESVEECEKIAQLLGLQTQELLKGLMKPKIRVGGEFVNKGQSREQVVNATGSLCKSIYSRCFSWLVERVNETLDVKRTRRQHFIGVLDIAGFEIFQLNGFEQLCINFTNEKLQQFFNYHMFVLEQEEYQKEEILWEMVEYGCDLQACIDLIEKPMGVFAILEEECIVPKASDRTFREKLYRSHFGKHPSFGKTRPVKGRAETHFDVHHYAGTVSYDISGWLEKNKDAKNSTVFELFRSASNPLLSMLYQNSAEEEKKGKIKKKTSVQTISYCHRKQLNKLMTNLKSTHPHFVRCILPNETKTEGLFDVHLVLHQLHCNNILEGLRITRKGFTVRMTFEEFANRYGMLKKKKLTKQLSKEKSEEDGNPFQRKAEIIMKTLNVEPELYRIGSGKIFFKARVYGSLEELRVQTLSRFVSRLQAQIRRFLVQLSFKAELTKKEQEDFIRRNAQRYVEFKSWSLTRLVEMINNKKFSVDSLTPATTAIDETRDVSLDETTPVANEVIETEMVQGSKNSPVILLEESIDYLKTIQTDGEAKTECNKCNFRSVHDFWAQEEPELKPEIAKKPPKKLVEISRSLIDCKFELETERNLREKIQSQLSQLQLKFDDLSERLEETEKLKDSQVEVIKKRESEAYQLKRDLESACAERTESFTKLKKKHQDAFTELTEKCDKFQKLHHKLDSEVQSLRYQLSESQLVNEGLSKAKETTEKSLKVLNQQIAELNQHRSEYLTQVTNANSMKLKLQSENNELANQLIKLQEQVAVGEAAKVKALAELDLYKLQNEIDARTLVNNGEQLKRIADELELAKERVEEEKATNSSLQAQLNKVNGDLKQMKSKLDSEGLLKADEIDGVRRKLGHKLSEADDRLDEVWTRCTALESAKQRLQGEIEDLLVEVEEANDNVYTVERKQKQFEKLIGEWKLKCEDFSVELEASQREARQYSADLSKLKSQNFESTEAIENLRRENCSLASVIKDLMDQLVGSSKSMHDLEKAKMKLELESEESKACIKDMSAMLEMNKSQLQEANSELNQLRHSIDTMLSDKEEEFENLKQTQYKALTSVQSSLEAEIKAKQEAIKHKKKLESDLCALEQSIRDSHKTNSDLTSRWQKLGQKVSELESQLLDEQNQKLEANELALASERRANSISTQLDEKATELRLIEKKVASLEMELGEVNERVEELNRFSSALTLQKKKLEAESKKMKAEHAETCDEMLKAEAKLKKTTEDAGRLAEELREEQEYSADLEKSKAYLESQIKDLHSRLVDTETQTASSGKRMVAKLEKRISDLECELEGEQKRHHEAARELRKNERQLKDLACQADEDKKRREQLQEQLERLHARMKSYKLQVEETEELAAHSLNKFRWIHQRMGESQVRGKSEQRSYGEKISSSAFTFRF